MVSQHIWDLCHGKETVSSLLAKDPCKPPHEIASSLYTGDLAGLKEHARFKRVVPTAEDLERALQCGNWGPSKPGDLFLKVIALLWRSALLSS